MCDGAVLRSLDFLIDARLLDHGGGLSNNSRRCSTPLIAVGVGADPWIGRSVLVDGGRRGSDELGRLSGDDLVGDVFKAGWRIGVAVVVLADDSFWVFLEVGGELGGVAGLGGSYA